MTRRTVKEEIVCDRCGRKEIVEGFLEHDLSSQSMISKLFPVWRYQKPEGWITIGDLIRPLGASDYCPKCAKELEQLLIKFFNTELKRKHR